MATRLRVMTSNATRALLDALAAEFERETGAVVSVDSDSAAAAFVLLDFFSSSRSAPLFRAKGLEQATLSEEAS